MKRRRAPAHIKLMLIGTAALVGCGQEPAPMTRDHYASLEDCAADWGRPENCDRAQSSGYGGLPFIFMGPLYGAGLRDTARTSALSNARRPDGPALADPGRQGRAIGKSTAPAPTARGGFGSSSRTFSAGS